MGNRESLVTARDVIGNVVFVLNVACTILDVLSGNPGPQPHNNTHEVIRRREECQRLGRQVHENEERPSHQFGQRAAEERERLERQRRKEIPVEHGERPRQMQQEREQQQEGGLRHEQGMHGLEEKSKARPAKQKGNAERKLQEQEALAREHLENSARLQAELESQLLRGIQPEVWPTPEERKHAEDQLLQPRAEYVHCAIAGVAGSGKSSLINAFRGVRNNSPGAAPTGVTERTLDISAYRDPSPTLPRSRFVWYDIPGAGTITIPGWQYFNNQGLFVFDLIIVVVDIRFTEYDIMILKHCERYKIPSFLVQSKANQHIGNTMMQDYEWDESEDERDFGEICQRAREKLVSRTKASIRDNLQAGGLDPEKEVFIVSRDALGSLVREEMEKLKGKNQLIDEPKLVMHCLEALRARRYLLEDLTT